eukprot:1138627-Pelagomonas_calceolata.AAC.1
MSESLVESKMHPGIPDSQGPHHLAEVVHASESRNHPIIVIIVPPGVPGLGGELPGAGPSKHDAIYQAYSERFKLGISLDINDTVWCCMRAEGVQLHLRLMTHSRDV